MTAPRTAGAAEPTDDVRLVEAARAVMDRSGWWGFKVEAVLREAGLSTRTFYRHFDSKNELLMRVLDDEMLRVAHRLETEALRTGTAEDALTAWVEGMLSMAYEDPVMRPAIMFAEHWRELLATFPTRMNEVVDELVDSLVPILERGQAEGVWPAVRPRQDAFCVFYQVATLTADVAASRGARPREVVVASVLPFIRRSLRSTDPGT